MIDNKSVMQQAIDSLIESSRLLGFIQDKKLCGTYTQIDSMFEAACYEIIEAKRQTILDAIAQSVDPDDLTIAYMSGLADGKKAAQEKENK